MIVRTIPDGTLPGGFLLIDQHDHGRVSGVFARNLSEGFVGGTLEDEALFAVANHDLAWVPLDAEPLWNREKEAPYSFVDYPVAPKVAAYSAGIDRIESESLYAALLCSGHYGYLTEGSDDGDERRFYREEKARRERLRDKLAPERLASEERDLAVLRFSDDLSLFVCLNEPGRNEHPFYRDGLRFRGERIFPEWQDEKTLGFAPEPFSRSFEVEVPYRVVGREPSGQEVRCGSYRVKVST